MSRFSRRERRVLSAAGVVAVLIVLVGVVAGGGDGDPSDTTTPTDGSGDATTSTADVGDLDDDALIAFERIADFYPVVHDAGESATSLAVADDGETFAYTDELGRSLGFLDLSDPEAPESIGSIVFDARPRAVALHDGLALVVLAETADGSHGGRLDVIEIDSKETIASFDLGGEPDDIHVSPDGSFAAIAIENPVLADEARPDGHPGEVAVVELNGPPDTWTAVAVELIGLADTHPGDPEPEAVAINDANQAVVSLQENNHLVIVDLATAEVVADFPAGNANLTDVDLTRELLGPARTGEILFAESAERRREPDGVAWIDATHFVTADEGSVTDDLDGGGRGITVFDTDGSVVAVSHLDHEIARLGRYPEHRSAGRGTEPEEVEVAQFGNRTIVFVSVEASDVVAVHEFIDGRLELIQMLPTGFGPEGMVVVPERNLLVVAAERTAAEQASVISVFRLVPDATALPVQSLTSANDADGLPIPWAALSGLAADPVDEGRLFAVSDNTFTPGFIYTIAGTGPGVITDRIRVTDASGDDLFVDLEGIAVAPQGGFWLASEATDESGGQLLLVDDAGVVQRTVEMPGVGAELAAGPTGAASLSGISVVGGDGERPEFVYVTFRVGVGGRYDPVADEWAFVLLSVFGETNAEVSGLTLLPDGRHAVLVSDAVPFPDASIRRLIAYDLDGAAWDRDGEAGFSSTNTLDTTDLLATLEAATIYSSEWLEGVAVTAGGDVVIVSDNAGVRQRPGETVFLNLGPADDLF